MTIKGQIGLNRVKSVSPMSDYRLDIVFRDGKHGIFDCRPYREYPCFKRIWDLDVFTKVVADHGTVMWPDGSDLCPDEVYDKTIFVNTAESSKRREGARFSIPKPLHIDGKGENMV